MVIESHQYECNKNGVDWLFTPISIKYEDFEYSMTGYLNDDEKIYYEERDDNLYNELIEISAPDIDANNNILDKVFLSKVMAIIELSKKEVEDVREKNELYKAVNMIIANHYEEYNYSSDSESVPVLIRWDYLRIRPEIVIKIKVNPYIIDIENGSEKISHALLSELRKLKQTPDEIRQDELRMSVLLRRNKTSEEIRNMENEMMPFGG